MFGKKKSFHKKTHLLIESPSHFRKKRSARHRILLHLISLKNFSTKKIQFRWGPLVMISGICMAIFIGIVIFSPYFEIKKISFQKTEASLDENLIKDTLSDFYGKNLFLFSSKEMQSLLQEKFPEFREIKIREKWPNEIELEITFSPPKINILNIESADYWVVSEDGVLLKKESSPALPTIKLKQYTQKLSQRQRLFNKETISSILKAKKIIEETAKIKIKEIIYLFAAREIHLVSLGETEIWLDITEPLEDQVEKLVLGANSLNLEKNDIEHIDLRIPDQIFWKIRK